MRIAVLSDIHGNLPALEAVVRDLATRGVDAVVNLGDSLSGPLLPRETAEFLMAQDWMQLAGNHERQLLDFAPGRRGASDRHAHAQLGRAAFEWMAALQHAQPLNDEVFLCHGTPRSDLEYFLDTVEPPRVRAATSDEIEERLGLVSAAVVVCGHTHIPRVVQLQDGRLLVNPGSAGLQAYEDEHPAYHLVENHSPDARYAIIERQHGQWAAQLLAVPYDHAAVARLARRHGRPDWEAALLYGRMSAPAQGNRAPREAAATADGRRIRQLRPTRSRCPIGSTSAHRKPTRRPTVRTARHARSVQRSARSVRPADNLVQCCCATGEFSADTAACVCSRSGAWGPRAHRFRSPARTAYA